MAPYHRIPWEHISREEEECGYDDHSCPPPSPPLLPPPLTRIQIDGRNHRLTMIVIIVASLLAACFLLLTYLTVLRYRSSRRRRRAASQAAAGVPQPAPDVDGEGDGDLRVDLLAGVGGDEPYHVWYIRTVGLDEPTIGAITVCSYKRGEGLVEGTDCAVCLGEFGEGELLRLLPKCSHAFHIPCVDTWLRSHVNCPLCRAPILAPIRLSPSPSPAPATAGGTNPGSATAAASAAVDQTALGVNYPATENRLSQITEEEGSEEDGIPPALPLSQVAVSHPPLGSSFSSDESEIWVPIDLGNGGLGDVAASDAPPEEGNRDGGLQPVPRSISMDSSALGSLLLRMRLVGSSGDVRRKPTAGEDPSSTTKKWGRIERNNRKVPPLPDAPLEMERSMSGGRFFLSAFSGTARGAILPL